MLPGLQARFLLGVFRFGVMLLTSSLRRVKRLVLCMLLLLLMCAVVLELWLGFLVIGELENLEVFGRGFDCAEKAPALLVFQGVWGDQPRHRVWKKLRVGDDAPGADVDAGWRHSHQHCGRSPAVNDRVGVG